MTDRTAYASRSATDLNNYGIHQAFKRSRVLEEPYVTPLLTVTNPIGDTSSNESIVTVIDRHKEDGRIRYTARKIDRLNDKQSRFESHKEFLERCLTSNVIPHGLKIELEASIGNHNEEFLAKWNDKLTKFSRELTQDVVEFCGTTIAETQQESTDATEELTRLANQEQLTEITSSLKQNQDTRKHQLKRNKDKKFYNLKYNTKTRASRPQYQTDDDRDEQNPRSNTYRGKTQQPRQQYHTSDDDSGTPHSNNTHARSVPSRQRSRNDLFPRRNNSFTNRHTKPNEHNNNNNNNNTALLERLKQLEAKIQQRPDTPKINSPGTNTDPVNDTNKQSSSGQNNQKNLNSVQSNSKDAAPQLTDMLDYITTTMSTLNTFKQHLTKLQNTSPTPSEMC